MDASALIDFNQRYPREVFPTMWSFVEGLACDGRLLISEAVADECHDQELRDLIDACPSMVVEFGAYQSHFAALMAEAPEIGLMLIDPANTDSNAADPHVVGLAMMLGGREPAALVTRSDDGPVCAVVTHERRSAPNARVARIPDVCDYYAIPVLQWLDLLRAETFSV